MHTVRLLAHSIGLLLLVYSAHGQSARPLWIGLDVFKNIPPLISNNGYVDRSLILEPALRWEIQKHAWLNLQMGYTHISKENAYQNLYHYRNSGFYLKGGLVLPLINPTDTSTFPLGFALGGSLTYTFFSEYGDALLTGPVFGDLRQPFSKRNREAWGLEMSLNAPLRLAQRWQLNFQYRSNLVYCRLGNTPFPLYYVPGAGADVSKLSEITGKNGLLFTGGFTVQIFYRLL